MKNGTPAFYSAVASLIPLILITYAFTLRVLPAITKMLKANENRRVVTSQVEPFIWLLVFIAPPAALVVWIAGEVASLNALYTGHPSRTNANWAINSLVVLAVAIVAHFLA